MQGVLASPRETNHPVRDAQITGQKEVTPVVVFTRDRYGNPGHPTRRFDMIRKLLRRGQVKIIGGGKTRKPPVVVFLNKVFNPKKTVDRKFLISVDPGYEKSGFAVCEVKNNSLVVLLKGEFKTGISNIKKKMTERRMYRRIRRYIRRLKTRRLSEKQNRNLNKYRKPKNVRSLNRISATLRYAVDVHVNLYGILHKLCPTPVYQTEKILEDNCFDTRILIWGKADGVEYQRSPRENNTKPVCAICGSKNNLEQHHLIQRKKNGTDVTENLIWLCKSCHESIHKGLIYLPVKGISHRALGTTNAFTGVLKNYKGFKKVSAFQIAKVREELGLQKTHHNDAIVAGLIYSGCSRVEDSTVPATLVKVRRHNRARIHSLRDRLYKLDGKVVARNRNKKTDQKEDSLAEFRQRHPELVSRLKVYPAVKLLNGLRKITVKGDLWKIKSCNMLFTAEGVISRNYVYSPELKALVGKPYVKPEICERVIRNQGVVVCLN